MTHRVDRSEQPEGVLLVKHILFVLGEGLSSCYGF